MTNVKPADIEALIEIFDKSDWDELHIASQDIQLHLAKDAAKVGRRAAIFNSSVGADDTPSKIVAAPNLAPTGSTVASQVIPAGLVAIRAPSLGTFYLAPKPGAPSFVEVGQPIHANTEMCVIEVMKLFTTVRAGINGTVRRVLVGDGQMVEFHQALFLVEPTE